MSQIHLGLDMIDFVNRTLPSLSNTSHNIVRHLNHQKNEQTFVRGIEFDEVEFHPSRRFDTVAIKASGQLFSISRDF